MMLTVGGLLTSEELALPNRYFVCACIVRDIGLAA